MRKYPLIAALFLLPVLGMATPPEPIPEPFNSADRQVPSAGAGAQAPKPAEDPLGGVTITWYGQSCFSVQDKVGHLVLTDPFDKTLGYPIPNVQPTIITVSHEHFDHNAAEIYPNFPVIIKSLGETASAGLIFHGISSFHDNAGGSRRGKNTIYAWKEGGLTLAHLGDLGQTKFTDEQLTALRGVDVLFIPVGGAFTVDAAQALALVNAIRPSVVIPMHYKTPAVPGLPLAPLSEFLKSRFPVQTLKGAQVTLTPETLPKQTTIDVLDYYSHGQPKEKK